MLYQDTHVQLKYVHNGVDITGSGSIKSPGYYKVIQKAEHRLTLERVGTDRHTTNNGPGSGIHIHVEENHLSGGTRSFCNPDSHSGAYPGSIYYIEYIIKKDGKEIKLPDPFHYAGKTYKYFGQTKPR